MKINKKEIKRRWKGGLRERRGEEEGKGGYVKNK